MQKIEIFFQKRNSEKNEKKEENSQNEKRECVCKMSGKFHGKILKLRL